MQERIATQPHDFLSSDWLRDEEGQLTVDVLENPKELIVRSAIAGVTAEDLQITLHEDTLTIRGKRSHRCKERSNQQLVVQECHWGTFSRSIILPTPVDPSSAKATLERGILLIRIKKILLEREIPVQELPEEYV